MKAIVLVGALIFAILFVATTFVPSTAARSEAAHYFSASEIDLGLEFSFQRRLLYWASTGLHLAALAWMVFSGFARKLADICSAWTGQRWLLTILIIGGFCFLVDEAIALPIGIIRLENLRAWGMTHRPLVDWLAYRALGVGIAAITGAVALVGLYLLLRFVPRWWWALASLGGMLLGMAYAFILPIVISPLFNTFTPLEKTAWADLQKPVEALARRVNVPVQEVLVVDASRQGSHTNAYFTGFGSTRRIVLYDTLLQAHTKLPPAIDAGLVGSMAALAGPLQSASLLFAQKTLGQYEVESILAHEMGHWLHDHIVKGIALATVASLLGFYVLGRTLRWAINKPPFLLDNLADPAGIPLVLLLTMVGLWLVSPVENIVSRHFERQADMVSLELTGRPEVFIATEKRLARSNISNVAPAPISVWFFNTHPTTVERIRMAEEWSGRRQ